MALGSTVPLVGAPAGTTPAEEAAKAVGTDAGWFYREVHAHDDQVKSFLRGHYSAIRDVEDCGAGVVSGRVEGPDCASDPVVEAVLI